MSIPWRLTISTEVGAHADDAALQLEGKYETHVYEEGDGYSSFAEIQDNQFESPWMKDVYAALKKLPGKFSDQIADIERRACEQAMCEREALLNGGWDK